ncbi:MAG: bifunctional diaminohydroxyphosphoribosylaminopyrimidine deaminase/5-amino-6-(5-phosphoribosylamino)uracil reductase RibD [Verrucomicrobiales bacterium]
MQSEFSPAETRFMRRALTLAQRGYGSTSPNPMVGAVLVENGVVIGEGYHHAAGLPHAEVEALRDAERKGHSCEGATLFVTLEPCSTHGRTPPCTESIIKAHIAEVIVASSDPNPNHASKGFDLLHSAGIRVRSGLLNSESTRLNAAFNHWIVHKRPYVTVKSAMSLDGKIATSAGESKWITSERSRALGMKLRLGSDAILTGIRTVLADDPALTIRNISPAKRKQKPLKRFILDSDARTPLSANVISDAQKEHTTILVSESAAEEKVQALQERVRVWRIPRGESGLDLQEITRRMGVEQITSLLVEGGGEAVASFFAANLAHKVYFFYAPRILGGRASRKSVAGSGFSFPQDAPRLTDVQWKQLPPDLLLTASVAAA